LSIGAFEDVVGVEGDCVDVELLDEEGVLINICLKASVTSCFATGFVAVEVDVDVVEEAVEEPDEGESEFQNAT
jgi:hypothetical protein